MMGIKISSLELQYLWAPKLTMLGRPAYNFTVFCLPVPLSLCPSVPLSLPLSLSLSLSLFLLSLYLSVSLSLSLSLSVRPSVCLSVIVRPIRARKSPLRFRF